MKMRSVWLKLSNRVSHTTLFILAILLWFISRQDALELAFWYAYRGKRPVVKAQLQRVKRFVPAGLIKAVLRSRAEITVMLLREYRIEQSLLDDEGYTVSY